MGARAALVTVTLVALAGASVSLAGSTTRYESTVTATYTGCGIIGPPPCDMGTFFHGRVKSRKGACKPGRSIKLRDESGTVFGTGTTESDGSYKIYSSPVQPEQDVTALVSKARLGPTRICLKDVSPPVHYVIPP